MSVTKHVEKQPVLTVDTILKMNNENRLRQRTKWIGEGRFVSVNHCDCVTWNSPRTFRQMIIGVNSNIYSWFSLAPIRTVKEVMNV